MKLSLGSIVLQRIFLYASIQAITALEYFHAFRPGPDLWAGWISLLFIYQTLPSGLLMLASGFPDVWAWVYVVVVRAIRRKKFAPGAWSSRIRIFSLAVVTLLFVAQSAAFVGARWQHDGGWWSVAFALLALPLLFLPVLPKNNPEVVVN